LSGEFEPRWLIGLVVWLAMPVIALAWNGPIALRRVVVTVATMLVALAWLLLITLVDRVRCDESCNTSQAGWAFDVNAWEWLLVYFAGVLAIGLLAVCMRFVLARRFRLASAAGLLAAISVTVAWFR
jgi:hypothetical protein